MEQVPNYLDDEAFEAPTNGLIQPLDIIVLLEEEGEVVREDPPHPQLPRDAIDSIMALADNLQEFRDFEEYFYNPHVSDSEPPEDYDTDIEYSDTEYSDTEYSDSD